MRKNGRMTGVYGKRRNLAITYNLQQTFLDWADRVALPLAEPSSPQISYTLSGSNMPSFTGDAPYTCKYAAYLYVWGSNGDASNTKTVYAKFLQNSTTKYTTSGTSVAASGRYCYSAYCFSNVVAGDTINAKVWGSTALNYYGYAMCVIPYGIRLDRHHKVMRDLQINFAVKPVITVGSTPTVLSSGYNSIQLSGEGSKPLEYTANTPTIDFFYPSETYNLCLPELGMLTTGASISTLSTQPAYVQNYAPTNITYQEINIDGVGL